MSVPDHVRESLRARLWKEADAKQWTLLSPGAKSASYEAWTRDPQIGGVLARFIGVSDVRVYLKDTLLKDFARQKNADDKVILRVLGLKGVASARCYIKPHGRRFADGRVVCWAGQTLGKAS